MTDPIPTAAIDAAAEALIPFAGAYTNRNLQSFVALEAAMPHLRKQVAEEIRARIPSPLEPRATQAESLIDVGMDRAARVVEKGLEQ